MQGGFFTPYPFHKSLVLWLGAIANASSEVVAQKFRGSKLRVVFSLTEPLVMLGLIMALKTVMGRAFHYFGDSALLYYASGLFPFYMFLYVSARVRTNITRLPGVTRLDQFFAVVLVESTIILLMLILVMGALWLDGVAQAIPFSVTTCALGILLLLVLGMGVGLVNMIIAQAYPAWLLFYGSITRGLGFLSGIFTIPSLLSAKIRDIIVWNPVLHGIELFRTGLYELYPNLIMDVPYLATWGIVALFLGVVLERNTIRARK